MGLKKSNWRKMASVHQIINRPHDQKQQASHFTLPYKKREYLNHIFFLTMKPKSLYILYHVGSKTVEIVGFHSVAIFA